MGFTTELRKAGYGVSASYDRKAVQVYLETDKENTFTVRDFTLKELNNLLDLLIHARNKVTDGKGE